MNVGALLVARLLNGAVWLNQAGWSAPPDEHDDSMLQLVLNTNARDQVGSGHFVN